MDKKSDDAAEPRPDEELPALLSDFRTYEHAMLVPLTGLDGRDFKVTGKFVRRGKSTLVYGGAGVGKSPLAAWLLFKLVDEARTIERDAGADPIAAGLYVSTEQTVDFVKNVHRALAGSGLSVAHATRLTDVEELIRSSGATFFVVDSLNCVEDVLGSCGQYLTQKLAAAQTRASERLRGLAQALDVAVVLVSHATRDNTVALSVKALHDVVLSLRLARRVAGDLDEPRRLTVEKSCVGPLRSWLLEVRDGTVGDLTPEDNR